jgi:hypothetical protein
MPYDVKALSCENCCTGSCPNQDHPSIVKAGLKSIVTRENMDFILSPLDLNQLHKFCRECPDYINDRGNKDGCSIY